MLNKHALQTNKIKENNNETKKPFLKNIREAVQVTGMDGEVKTFNTVKQCAEFFNVSMAAVIYHEKISFKQAR